MDHEYVYQKGNRLYAVFVIDGKQIWKATGLEASSDNMTKAKNMLPELKEVALEKIRRRQEQDSGCDTKISDSEVKEIRDIKTEHSVDISDEGKIIIGEIKKFEERLRKELNTKLNMMGNSFEYIVKMLENSGMGLSVIDREKISWQSDMKNLVYELMKIDNDSFPTYNSVLKRVCLKLRDVYGIVIDQLRKEYKSKYGVDRASDVLEIISESNTEKDLFESVLRSLFPAGYWHHEDGVACADYSTEKAREVVVRELIEPLAKKYNDSSKGYNKTFREVYKNMDCAWGNLQTRYKRVNRLKANPQKFTIVVNNPTVFKKFKRTVGELLDETV